MTTPAHPSWWVTYGQPTIGPAAVLAVALYTQSRTSRREVSARRAESDADGLTALFEAGVRLRAAADAAGRSTKPAAKVATELNNALAEFTFRSSAVRAEKVRAAAETWQREALRHFSGDPDSSRQAEANAWKHLLITAAGVARTVHDGR